MFLHNIIIALYPFLSVSHDIAIDLVAEVTIDRIQQCFCVTAPSGNKAVCEGDCHGNGPSKQLF